MSTTIEMPTNRRLLLIAALVALLAISVTTPSYAETGEGRTSASNQNLDQYGALQTEGGRQPTASASRNLNTGVGSVAEQLLLLAFWVYEADVILFADDDDDGHFYGIDLLLDADTIYASADVYAAVYLSLAGGPWNEYAVTEDFTIFGESGTDEYTLVTELMSGYPTGSYDLLIELFDSYDGSYLASFGPENTSSLSTLPLEDFNRDAPAFDQPITVSRGGGGGSAGIWFFLMLLGMGWSRLRAERCGVQR